MTGDTAALIADLPDLYRRRLWDVRDTLLEAADALLDGDLDRHERLVARAVALDNDALRAMAQLAYVDRKAARMLDAIADDTSC